MRFDPAKAKTLRIAAYRTQTEACEAVGISRQSLHAIETGASTPSADTVGAMADAYRVTTDAFFTDPDPAAAPSQVGAAGPK